jgi:voltage-gated potassium channel
MGNSNNGRSAGEGLSLKHTVLMMLLLGLLLFRPILPQVIANAIFLPTMIVSAWLAGGKSRLSLIVTIIAGIGTLLFLSFDIFVHEQFHAIFGRPLGLVIGIAILGLLLYCGGVILHSLLTVERVFVNEIIGTFNMYLIMGFTWALIYFLLELIVPGSFLPLNLTGNHGLRFLYFSFITITTVGFGDTVPATEAAEMFVVLEAIVGQFYVAVVVAYLVSMYITHELSANRKDD